MPMTRRFRLYIFLAVCLFFGCSGKDKSQKENAGTSGNQSFTHIYQNRGPYKGWERYRFLDIVLIHPPDHPQQDHFEDIAKIFSALVKRTSTFLKITPPDSIIIYFYTGVGHGMTVTGRDTPFSDGTVIHFWFPSFYGPPIVKHLLPLWYQGEPEHEFLKHGIIALLDGSGQNYHLETLKFIDSGTYIPLRRLSVDTTINVDFERYQSAEAASFVDYIVYAYDIGFLKILYASKGSFSGDVESTFHMPVASLERQWQVFLKIIVAPKKDSLKKLTK